MATLELDEGTIMTETYYVAYECSRYMDTGGSENLSNLYRVLVARVNG